MSFLNSNMTAVILRQQCLQQRKDFKCPHVILNGRILRYTGDLNQACQGTALGEGGGGRFERLELGVKDLG